MLRTSEGRSWEKLQRNFRKEFTGIKLETAVDIKRSFYCLDKKRKWAALNLTVQVITSDGWRINFTKYSQAIILCISDKTVDLASERTVWPATESFKVKKTWSKLYFVAKSREGRDVTSHERMAETTWDIWLGTWTCCWQIFGRKKW